MANQANQGAARVGNVQNDQPPAEQQNPPIVPADPVHQPSIAPQNVPQAARIQLENTQGGV